MTALIGYILHLDHTGETQTKKEQKSVTDQEISRPSDHQNSSYLK